MAEYTVELGKLIECGYTGVDEAFNALEKDFGDSAWLKEVKELFIEKFYFREIGFETPDLFVNRMKFAFHLLLPYYRERRKINMLDVGLDPLVDYTDMSQVKSQRDLFGDSKTTGAPQTTYHGKTIQKNDSHNDTDGKTLDYAFPMTGGSSSVGGTGELNPDYASSGTVNNDKNHIHDDYDSVDDSTTTQKLDTHNESTSLDAYEEKRLSSGSHAAKFELLSKYRDVIENLNAKLLSEQRIEKLFMGVM